jgi:hypothetical protein
MSGSGAFTSAERLGNWPLYGGEGHQLDRLGRDWSGRDRYGPPLSGVDGICGEMNGPEAK